MTPDLRAYDYIVINSSAGKDSQAMLHRVATLAKAAGVLDRVVVVHADLGRVEWEGTRELAEEQARHYGVRFEVVSRPQGDLLQHVTERGKWPSSTARYCTSDHKRGQVQKLFTRLSREAGRPIRILNCLGLRADESPNRAKRAAFSTNERASCASRHVSDWLPIHDWSQERVWWVIQMEAGTRWHAAYDLGMPRLSCCFCIFAPKSALVLAGKHNPTLLRNYVAVEELIGHTFRQDCSMADVAAAVAAGEKPGVISDAWNM
jgi:3'-phosphoadenosine 5'-phosphosulfate sulfotransferase (PAPS reductase)/FAD synthetase